MQCPFRFLLFTYKTHYVLQIHLTIDVCCCCCIAVDADAIAIVCRCCSQYSFSTQFRSFAHSIICLYSLFDGRVKTMCLTCIYEVLRLLVLLHVFFPLFHYLKLKIFFSLFMFASLSSILEGSILHKILNAHMFSYDYC